MKLLLSAFLALIPSIAMGHESPSGQIYEASCCNGNSHTGDCQMIPASAVRATSQGYEVTLKPGQHRLVTKEHRWIVPYGQERMSTDGEAHACLWPSEDELRCFYIAPQSF